MNYRPQIDGLRAIAVLAVVIYHAQFEISGIKVLQGGFIGVDIFFVISGYLITSIIFRKMQVGTFSFMEFYGRRARRILPALLTVMLASIPFAWLYLLPEALVDYSSSVLTSLLFSSNFVFWLQDSYTAEPSALKPFLHTWSLSIEEQFYLFFPAILLFVWKKAPSKVAMALVIIFTTSLAIAHVGSKQFVDANFFLITSRAWEMLAGALLAKWELSGGALKSATTRFGLNVLALVMIFGSIYMFNEQTRHPSLLTLLPVAGTVVLIHCAHSNDWIAKVLSCRLMTSVGLISYSLYLWHFPLFAFARVRGLLLDNNGKLLIVVVSFLLAVLSYYLIEKPFRSYQQVSAKFAASSMVIVIVVIAMIQSYFYFSMGAPKRLGPALEIFASAKARSIPNGEHNISESGLRLVNTGDSHAGVFSASIKGLAKRHDLNFTQIAKLGCTLAPGLLRFYNDVLDPDCSDLQKAWFSQVDSYDEAIIFYSSRFNLYLKGERFNNHKGGKEDGYKVILTTNMDGQPNIEGVKSVIVDLIRGFLNKGRKVVLMYPIPEVGWHVPKLVKTKLDEVAVQQRMKMFRDLSLTTSYDLFLSRSKLTYEMYDAIGEHENLLRIYPSDYLCSVEKRECYLHDDKHLFYYDDDHITRYISNMIINDVERELIARGWL